MSRVGKKPVPIPAGVKVDVSGGRTISVTGPKGNLSWTAPTPISVAVAGSAINVTRPDDARQTRALHGTTRALIANMVEGVAKGYEIGLEVYGTGYTCKLQGRKLLLNLGYMGRGVGRTAQFMIDLPAGVDVQVLAESARGENEPARFVVKGPDKYSVGQFAAELRRLRKPEPYKGKGVRYAGEQIKRKAGKVFAGGGG